MLWQGWEKVFFLSFFVVSTTILFILGALVKSLLKESHEPEIST